ncbi:DNA topoisomerase 1 beta-like [Iris pallida]|uniref:DNA topoisomerase I n=1 Tax=Iris pallida TaxID=29817 RepID=A0AAX6FT58_IRIPA|nr:DNA topoisomerase 1 beta-like [Iris pallida]
MAVNERVKQVSFDDEDEDAPIVFKRNTKSAPPKQKEVSSSAVKKPPLLSSSSKNDGSSLKRPMASQSAVSGEGSSSQKSKVVSAGGAKLPKAPGTNSSVVRTTGLDQSKNGTASNNGTKKLRRDDNGKDDSDEDEKPLRSRYNAGSVGGEKSNSTNSQKVGSNNAETKVSDKLSSVKNEAPDDSDDEKPLSARFSSPPAASQKSSCSDAAKAPASSKPTSPPPQKLKTSVKEASDDSEDEKPLLSRLPSKSSAGASGNKPESANGTGKKESSSNLKLPAGSNKRPFGNTNNSSSGPSAKKAKLSDGSIPTKVKNEVKTDDSDHIPVAQRMKKTVSSNSQSSVKNVIKKSTSSSLKINKKKMMKKKKQMKNSKYSKSSSIPPGSDGGKKWTTLEHNGVIFPPPYKPHGIKMLYNGQPVDLTPEQEEVATMFAVMKDTDFATKQKFIDNFWADWKQILGKNHVIKKFELCDFTPIYEWHLREKEKKKQMTSEEKKALKEEKLKQEEKYMWAVVDGVKEKVGNFRVEPPGLFRGRGEHPKMGKLKQRIRPEDITINIGKGAPIPECPIPGARWGEVKHDNTVTWLAFWNDPISQKELKYVFLAPSSKLKGQTDKQKYEKARLLKDYIHNIRANYTKDFTSKDPTKRQIAVATYLIDKLALRAGNEKDDDEADTVGCCTLKVENVVCVPPNKLQFDFLGKDSIRYFNTVEVELPVYKAVGEFRAAKKGDGKKKADGDDLFDMLDTSKLNTHLKELMPGLTAKVFRTYNASITLDDMLNKETKDGTLNEKVAVYQVANKEVAIICNHQRSVSKTHDAQMSRLNEKIDELKSQRQELKEDLSRARKGKPPLKDKEGKPKRNLAPEVIEKKLSQVDAKIDKMEIDKKVKEDLKTVALGTSKINYLDPRISVAWCKRHEVPIEKIFNKSLLAKFAWAMDVDPDYRF